jgi:hypothetical protein
MIFYLNISVLEEREDLDTLSIGELHGILIAYEIRIEKNNHITKEATFKSSKKTKKKNKQKEKQIVVVAMIQRKMKKQKTSYKS